MAIYTHVMEELIDISAQDAIELLCNEFNLGLSVIKFTKTNRQAKLKTLSKTSLLGLSASDVGPVEFWGGPPGYRKRQVGTLLTHLCDAILYQWTVYGNYTELVCGTKDE